MELDPAADTDEALTMTLLAILAVSEDTLAAVTIIGTLLLD